jgi:hypothetical protein
VATANKMSKMIYIMVKTKVEYDEKRIQINEPAVLQRKLKSVQKYVDKLKEQMEYHENLSNTQVT